MLPHNRWVRETTTRRVAILGGTGSQGRGLARRLAIGGWDVVIGSRDAGRAAEAASSIASDIEGGAVTGAPLEEAARSAPLVIVAVPWEAHAATLQALRDALADRIVIDCVNPLRFGEHGPVAIAVQEGSACQQAAALLPDSRVVGAFHHVAAPLLLDPTVVDLDTDVLVVGDDVEASEAVVAMVDSIAGLRGVRAGRLADAGQVEALTVNLIRINRRLKVHAGLRITGI